jgi:pimeloyl-ACP methyl ester carboxylesterase
VETCALLSGRRAQVWAGGADAGPVVLVHHGTPDTRWVARTDDAALTAREALAAPDGYLRDATLLGRPWGLGPAAVRCPVRLWAGEHDARNPPPAARWWAGRLPGAGVTVTPTTHLATLLRSWPDVLAWLVDPA